MRITVATAVACLLGVGVSTAHDARAAITKETTIPAQGLRPALKQLANERDVQLVYRSEVVGERQTSGAVGDLTFDEALTKLLKGTGLTYQYIDDRAITIVPMDSRSSTQHSRFSTQDASDGVWGRFRLAQAEQGSSAPNNSPTEDLERRVTLEEVIVTAQKREERLQDVPISISVLSGENLDRSTVQGVSEALSRVPGVSVQSIEARGSRVVIRGLQTGVGSSPNAYYLDGVPFSLIKEGFVPADAAAFDLQRIEVLRGPQGTLYGANALSGVVRVLTQDPDLDRFEVKARTSGSSTDEGAENYRGDLALNVPLIEGKFAARAAVSYQDMSGWVDGPLDNDINDAKLRSYRLKLAAQPTEQLSIGLSAWLMHDDHGAPDLSTDDQRSTATIPQPYSNDMDVYALKIGYAFSNFSVTSMTSYFDYQADSVLDLAIYHVPAFPAGTPFYNNFDSRILSEELVLSSHSETSWQWTAGAFYRDAEDGYFAHFPAINPLPREDKNGSESYAVFGELGRRFFNDRWEWTLGLRYYHDEVFSEEVRTRTPTVPLYYADASFSATTPRAVLRWYPRDNVTVYGTYAQGFRGGFPQNAVPHRQGFAPLEPDELHNYEVGAKATVWDQRLSFDLALYYLQWKDSQQSLLVPTSAITQTFAFVNGESASGAGVDFAATIRPIDGLELGASVGWNDLTWDADTNQGIARALLFAEGERLNFSSEWIAAASADYVFPIGGGGFQCRVSGSANYSSAQVNFNRPASIITEGEARLFARVGLSLVAPQHWTATLFVDNVTNEYEAPPNAIGSFETYSRVRPRTIGIQFEYQFSSAER